VEKTPIFWLYEQNKTNVMIKPENIFIENVIDYNIKKKELELEKNAIIDSFQANLKHLLNKNVEVVVEFERFGKQHKKTYTGEFVDFYLSIDDRYESFGVRDESGKINFVHWSMLTSIKEI